MTDPRLQLFQDQRHRLMALAYRMLGTVAEAEEVVQEVYIRWQQQPEGAVDNPGGWLLAVCGNLALDTLKQAYKRREVYTGPWLPEPVVDGVEPWQETALAQSESMTTAFLLLLEQLAPVERAVYLLHDVFGYRFAEIAPIVERNADNCRKIAQRARRRIQADQPRFDPPGDEDVQVLATFFETVKQGDVEQVKRHLSAHAQFWSDSDGKVAAATKVVEGADAIGKLLLGIDKLRSADPFAVRTEFVRVNGRAGILLSRRLKAGGWAPETVISVEFEDGKVARIYAMRNPDKFGVLGARGGAEDDALQRVQDLR